MADGTICIWTPQGLKCSASPVKSHYPDKPGHGPCGVDAQVRADIKARKTKTDQHLGAYLGHAMHVDDWLSQVDHAHPSDVDRQRARVIARVVELMLAADVSERDSFTIVQMPARAAGSGA